MQSAVKVNGLSKSFGANNRALKEISFKISSGEMVALIGASGSGKSTLLRLISGLIQSDQLAETEISIFGKVIQKKGKISANARALRSRIGVVFQKFNLVNRLSVLTNVLIGNLGSMPRWKGNLGLFSKAQKRAAMHALERVGMVDRKSVV